MSISYQPAGDGSGYCDAYVRGPAVIGETRCDAKPDADTIGVEKESHGV